MLHVLGGLAGALVTLIVYSVLCEKVPDISLRRRQLDAWACLLSLGWLAGIAYGGASVQSVAPLHGDSGPAPNPILHPPPVLRLTPPALGRPDRVVQSPKHLAAPTAVALAAQMVEPEASLAVEPEDDASAGADFTVAPWVPAPADAHLAPTAVSRLGAATMPAVRVASPIERAPALVTRVPGALPPVLLPTLVPTSTPMPTPALPDPAPTEICGDPRDIRLEVRFGDAEADNDGPGLAVRYRLHLANNSGFPVSPAEGVLAAISQGPSAEQFGSKRFDDVTLAASSTFDLEGTLNLDRRPSPMTRTDLCISFVAESCGVREPYKVFRRCTRVHGF